MTKARLSLPGLYLITDGELSTERLLEVTRLALASGISLLQYRNKEASTVHKRDQALALRRICNEFHVPFIINDDVDLALEVEADGVHLGREDTDYRTARERLGADRLIGVSCYNDLARASQAIAGGADYIAFGAMYPSSSKTNTVKANPELLREAGSRWSLPVVAIGGITPDNCSPLLAAGADLLAVISSVYRAADPGQELDRFRDAIQKHMRQT